MLEKLKNKGVDINTLDNSSKNKEKQIEDFINELSNDVKRKLEVCIYKVYAYGLKKHYYTFFMLHTDMYSYEICLKLNI